MQQNSEPQPTPRLGAREAARLSLVLLSLLFLASCTFLSDKQYVEDHAANRGIRRVVVFLQRWPCYLQLPGQNDLGEGFIKKTTHFLGPWKSAVNLEPRAVDVQDINDALMGEILLEALQKKGYQPFLAQAWPSAPPATVEMMMAQYQALDPGVDAFLFCYYAPTLFLSQAPTRPLSPRSYSLQEIVQQLSPSGEILWAGPRASLAPENSISHAFIYISVTMFKALNWQSLWEVAGSQAGGRLRPWVPQCPPGPTDQNYKADPDIIRTLMVDNLKCRLRYLIPTAF